MPRRARHRRRSAPPAALARRRAPTINLPRTKAPILSAQPDPTSLATRLARNVGWLAGSKGLGALLSLVYLALAARTLGLAGFGAFATVLAYGQLIVNFAQFQSWQLVIRFGAGHLAAGDHPRLERLLSFAVALDAGSALFSAAAGFLLAGTAAALLGWPAGLETSAAWFGLSLLLWLRATPIGALRLLDRFDQLSAAETVTPIVRFAGAIAASIWFPSITAFLLVWTVSEILSSLMLWALARRTLARRGVRFRAGWPRGVRADNPGLWAFAWASNATASVNLAWQQVGTLVVGAESGVAAAGGFRMAFQIAQALAKPALLLGRVIYPELARLGGDAALDQAVRRATRLALISGAILVLLSVLLGRTALVLIGGPDYGGAAWLLVILTGSVAIDLWGFALEPALLALGRAWSALIARAAGAAAYAVLLTATIDRFDAYGAAWAAVGGSVVALAGSILLLRRARALS